VTCAVIIAAIAASDLSAAFLDKEHVYTAGKAIVRAAERCPGACMCGPGRPGGETLDPPGGARSATCRIVESAKAAFEICDVTATKFLTHPLFSGCTNWPRLENGKGKKRAAGVPAASVATSVDLGSEEGGAPPAQRSNSSLLEGGGVYAIGAPAGNPERKRKT
jgi:hypothetical protein